MKGFKDIPGYEGEYQVNDIGEVYSLPRRGEKFICIGKIRKPQKHPQGYLFVNLRKHTQWLIHRLVAITFIPNPENKPFVNHKNGIKTDNRVDNLEWCTRLENEHHAYKTNLKNSTGSNNTMAKLNDAIVRDIKEKFAGGTNRHELAKDFEVNEITIRRIVQNKTWRHVI